MTESKNEYENQPSEKEIRDAAHTLSKLPKGFLPKELFEQVTRIVVTPIIEVVPLRKVTGGSTEVLLLRRERNDPAWPGMQHTPGTVLRSTDVNDGFGSAFSRIMVTELGLTEEKQPNPQPVTTIFHEVNRGAELANVFFVDLTGVDTVTGSWHPVDQLPEDLVETQLGFIVDSVNKFERKEVA